MTSRLQTINVYSRSLLLLLMLLMMMSGHAQSSITAMEYYIDTDPGIDAGVDISLTSGVDLNIDLSINTSTLDVGFHQLVVRAGYSDGTWGIHASRVFYVSASSVSSSTTVAELEYFFDSDPGHGIGDPITLTPSGSVDTDALISTSSLSSGFHTLSVRAKDSDGFWGMMNSRVFYIDDINRNSDTQIASVEYFIDTDPGFGSGTQYVISPAQASIDEDITVSTSSLADGDYAVGIRVMDTDGNFSITQTASFTICSGADVDFSATTVCAGSPTEFSDLSTGTLAGDIYSWDFDGDDSEDSNVVGDISFTYPSSGTYTAKLTIDQNGCVVSKSVEVSVVAIPVADAGSDQTITTDNTTLAATAVNDGETGVWSIVSGTATITDVNNPSTTVTDIDGSQVQLRWTVTNDAADCEDFDEMVINVGEPLSEEADIVGFSLEGLNGVAVIDNSNHTVTAEVVFGSGITSLEPTIVISEGASISPTGPQDFTNPVVYTVTAEDGVSMQDWTVTVVESPLGLNQNSGIQVYPNPATNKISINGVEGESTMSVCDLSGRIRLVKENVKELSLVDLEPGTYLLYISVNGDSPISVRIIKGN